MARNEAVFIDFSASSIVLKAGKYRLKISIIKLANYTIFERKYFRYVLWSLDFYRNNRKA